MDEAAYQQALDVIQRARQDPGADAEKLRSLVGMVKEHQAGQQTQHGLAERQSIFAQGEPAGGAQGGEKLQQVIGSPEANEQRAQAEATGIPTLPQGERDPFAEGAEDNEAQAQAILKDYQDRSLPSASGVKALYRPPEYTPAQAARSGPMGALSTVMSFTDHYREPTIEQFRRDMAPILGAPRAMALDEQSPEYEHYADAQWAKVYDQAKAEGKAAVRHSYTPKDGAPRAIASALATWAAMAGAAAGGAAHAATFGLGNRLMPDEQAANLERAGEEFPVARGIGNFAGAIANPALRAFGGIGGKAVGALPDALRSPLGDSALASGIGGAVAGGAASLGEDAVDAATSEQRPDLAMVGRRAIDAAGGGMVLGATGDLLAQGAKGIVNQLRTGSKLAPFVNLLEEGGGSTSFLRGVKPGEAMSEAKIAAGGTEEPLEHLAGEMVGPMAREARARVASQEAATEATNQSYYQKHAGDTRPVGPLVDWLTRARAELTGPDGQVLPGREQVARTLDQYSNKLVKVEGVYPGDVGLATRSARTPGMRMLTGPEAAARGIDVTQAIKDSGFPPEMADQLNFIVTPQKLNPQQVDALHDGINLVMKEGKGGEPDPALAGMGKAVRQVRDQFPGDPILGGATATIRDPATGKDIQLTGWSAFKHRASQQAASTNRTLGMAGVNGALPETPDANQFKAARGAIADYGNPKRGPENEALRELAADASRSSFERPEGQGRLDDYLRYGHLDVNEYLRDPEGFASSRTPTETKAISEQASAFAGDLQQAPRIGGSFGRMQRMTKAGIDEALAKGELSFGAPSFASSDPRAVSRFRALLNQSPDKEPVQITFEGSAVDVSGAGQKRPGEVLVPGGDYKITNVARRDGVLHVTVASPMPDAARLPSEDLATIGGLRGAGELEKRSHLLGGGIGEYHQRMLNRGRLSLDPMFRKLAGMNGAAAGRGAVESMRGQALGFVGPDGNGRSISDDEAERVKNSVDLWKQLRGQF